LHEGLERVIAGTKRAAQEIEYPAVVHALQHLIGGEQGLRVFERGVLEAGLKFGAGVARWDFERNGLGHFG
jgi:hypothetical protein